MRDSRVLPDKEPCLSKHSGDAENIESLQDDLWVYACLEETRNRLPVCRPF
jgi:hypothetical protein